MSSPHFPSYIPDGIDVAEVISDINVDGVSAPQKDHEGLKQVVLKAKSQGIDLKIIFVPINPPIDTPLRDLATEVGVHEGGTVLALSPNFVGTYSDTIDRVTLESGQDVAKTGQPVLSANNFLDEVAGSTQPWNLFTVTAIVAVAIGVAVAKVTFRSSASAQLTGIEPENETQIR
ncbi:MAG: DUF6676 family protein [Mycobacteriaceae bacterium]